MTSLTNAVRGIRGAIVYMQNATTPMFYRDGVMAWSDDGRIVLCGDYHELRHQLPPQMALDDWRQRLIIPGFVDCHVHLPQLDCRNKTGHTLLDWLKYYIFPAEAMFADPHHARAIARRFFQELVQHGTTTAMIHSTIHEHATDIAFEEAEAAGIRAIIGKVMMDRDCPDNLKERTADSLHATERLIQKWHGKSGRLFYAVTPRFALTCSRELIVDAGRMARESGAYFQTHLAETPDEVRLALEQFRAAHYVGLYEDCQCLGPHSMYAHCIYLSDHEWRQLSLTRSAVAHCPSSNIFLQSGRMPYEKIREHSVRCGLGSDVGAGPEFSLWDVIRCGFESHPVGVFPKMEALYRATLGGAEALGLAETIGSFEPGKCADVAVFDCAMRAEDPLEAVGGTTVPRWCATYVAGRRL